MSSIDASLVTVEIDWDKDGTYTDESDRVRPVTAPVQVSYGRDQITALAPTVAGTGSFTLDNRTRRYSPRAATLADGTANPLYGDLKPARPVKITRTITGTAEQITRTNKASNPKLGTASTFWTSFAGTGGAVTQTRETSGGPTGSATFARLTWTTGTSAVDGGLFYGVSETNLDCLPGQYVSARAMIRASVAQRIAFQVQYLNSGGANIGATNTTAVLVANTWTEFKLNQSTVAPANTAKVRLLMQATAGTGGVNWAIGNTLDSTAVVVLFGQTAPASYFDGSTTALGNLSYRWTGTADASTSEEYVAAVADAEYSLFTGHTDDNPINPDPDSPYVSPSLVDYLADFRGQNISTPLYRGIRTGEAIGYILDACGWPAADRDLDLGATIIPWWWEDGTDALTALENVIRSEGPPALLTMSGDNEVVFRDRHHRLLDSVSLTAQQTWRAHGYGLVMARGTTSDEGWRNIINTGNASVDVRIPQSEAAVWSSEATIRMSAGEEKLVTATATDPFYDAVVPVAGTDFVQVSGTTTATLFRDTGASATIKLFSASASVISGLQLRAKVLAVSYTVQVSASDTESIDQYGSRSFPGDLPWCNQYDAEAVLASAVAQRAEPLPVVQARFVVGIDTAKFPLLGRDLSDRVTVVEDETSTNGDFYIESITHSLSGPLDHEVIFGLEAAPTGADPALMFDTTGQGFDDGEFGGGISDPDTLLLFDGSTGHRFDEGQFVL